MTIFQNPIIRGIIIGLIFVLFVVGGVFFFSQQREKGMEQLPKGLTHEQMIQWFKEQAEKQIKVGCEGTVKELEDENKCEKFKDLEYRDMCYFCFATEKQIPSLCEKISDNFLQEECKQEFVEEKEEGLREKAYLGVCSVAISDLGEQEIKKLPFTLEENYGELIVNQAFADIVYVSSECGETGIFSGSPAEIAGLRAGDILLEVDGEKIINLGEALDKYQPNDIVSFKVFRDGLIKTIEVKLDKSHLIEFQNIENKIYHASGRPGETITILRFEITNSTRDSLFWTKLVLGNKDSNDFLEVFEPDSFRVKTDVDYQYGLAGEKLFDIHQKYLNGYQIFSYYDGDFLSPRYTQDFSLEAKIKENVSLEKTEIELSHIIIRDLETERNYIYSSSAKGEITIEK